MTSGQLLRDTSRPALRRYAELAAGSDSLGAWLRYDLLTGLFGNWPGAVGLALRRLFYRYLLAEMGSGVTIGCRVSLRGANRISLGDGAFVDEGCALDARGPNSRIELAEGVLVARHTIMRARHGITRIGRETSVGSNCILSTDSRLDIGEKVLIAAFCYLCAGGSHRFEDPSRPISEQGCAGKGGIRVGDGAWIGAKTLVLDGAVVGRRAVIGAQSLVRDTIPDLAVAHGSPAKVHRSRDAAS